MPRNQTEKLIVDASSFLRSINIRYDAEYPDRIAHFRPTAKCVTLLRSLLGQTGDRSFFVVAPYGTGKSITATYLLQLLENRKDAEETLRIIETRLKRVHKELARFSRLRRSSDRRGLVLVLHGYVEDVPCAVKQAGLEAMKRLKLGREANALTGAPTITIDDTIGFLTSLKEKALKAGCDHIAIVWDEFGRHIESLVSEGRASALLDIQVLAEFAARTKVIPVTLGLLLHQDLLQYAGNVPQSVRAEWRKVEGRFKAIHYIDDSKEVYRLIAESIAARASGPKPPTKALVRRAAKHCAEYGLFSDFNLGETERLLYDAYPLEPVSLHLLPRLSARVAQNERTLYNFLYEADLTDPAGPEELFDFFSAEMRTDTAVGGTYRRWLETQSALTKSGGEEEAERALKSACLLGLGASGERARAGRGILEFAIRGYDEAKDGQEIIDRLIEKHLLIYRRHSDEVAVWHGTDADLRGRLEEEKARHRDGFNLLDFLSKEAPPKIWRPVRYNDEFHIRRYLRGEFHDLATLQRYLSWDVAIDAMPIGCDGKVLYLVAETRQELAKARQLAQEHLKHNRVILAIPSDPLPVFEAALEVFSLIQLEYDTDLVETDPLVLPELRQMADDAREHMERQIDRLVRPSPSGPRWFYQGAEFQGNNPSGLRLALSGIVSRVYNQTPKINSEAIVRERPTPIQINSRKKLLLGILERSGRELLGLDGNFPDSSMFRTVLLKTGIYRETESGRWGYAEPHEIDDPGTREVWSQVKSFLTEPADSPKDIRGLLARLKEPPYGVRAGLFPILLAAGLRAFPSALSFTRDGVYVPDLLPTVVEDLCRETHRFRLTVLNIDDKTTSYLSAVHMLFSENKDLGRKDLIRSCYDAVEEWKAHLPAAALTTRGVTERAGRLQRLMMRPSEPVRLLLEEIPATLGHRIDPDADALLKSLADCKVELEETVRRYFKRAGASTMQALGFSHAATTEGIRDLCRKWAACFSEEHIEGLTDGIAKGLVIRVRMGYETDEHLMDSLSSLLVGKSIARWDDSAMTIFDREIQNAVHRVEEHALSNTKGGDVDRSLADLVCGRIDDLIGRLVEIAGKEETESRLWELMANQNGKGNHGHHSGSVSQSA